MAKYCVKVGELFVNEVNETLDPNGVAGAYGISGFANNLYLFSAQLQGSHCMIFDNLEVANSLAKSLHGEVYRLESEIEVCLGEVIKPL